MKRYLLIIIIILLPTISQATLQRTDFIIYDNKIYDLWAYPLESFFPDYTSKPFFREELKSRFNTANLRGYVAIWEIEANTLYLIGIKAWIADAIPPKRVTKLEKANLKEIFGDKCQAEKVAATWFSGELGIQEGKELPNLRMKDGSLVFEREIIFTVKAGKVIDKKFVDNTNKALPSPR